MTDREGRKLFAWTSTESLPKGALSLWQLAAALRPRWAQVWLLAEAGCGNHVREMSRVQLHLNAARTGQAFDWSAPWSPEMVQLFAAASEKRTERIEHLARAIRTQKIDPVLRGAMVSDLFVTRGIAPDGAQVEIPRWSIAQSIIDLRQGRLLTADGGVAWRSVSIEEAQQAPSSPSERDSRGVGGRPKIDDESVIRAVMATLNAQPRISRRAAILRNLPRIESAGELGSALRRLEKKMKTVGY